MSRRAIGRNGPTGRGSARSPTTVPRAAGPPTASTPPRPTEQGLGSEREAAIVRLQRRRKLAQDAFVYLGVNGVLWLVWALTDRTVDGGLPWPAWVSLIWGFLLALDAWRAYGRWPGGPDEPITEAEIAHEIDRSRSR